MSSSRSNKSAANDRAGSAGRRVSRINRPIESATIDGQEFQNGRCSPAQAKQTLEENFEQLSPLKKLLLARQLGYGSFASLLAASTVVTLSDGSAWWLTADRFGAWTAWNLCALEFQQSSQASEITIVPGGNGI